MVFIGKAAAAISETPSSLSTETVQIPPVSTIQVLPLYYPTTVVLQQPPSQPKPAEVSEWSKPATYTAILGQLLAFLVVGYTLSKDARARKQSVEDDYWLRKVVGPIAIEPLLKAILDMIACAPPSFGSNEFTVEAITEYHDKRVKELSQLAVNSSSLQLIDKQLASSTAGEIDGIQDMLIEYCFANKHMHEINMVVAGHDRMTFQTSAKEKLIGLLGPIREFQSKNVGRGRKEWVRFIPLRLRIWVSSLRAAA